MQIGKKIVIKCIEAIVIGIMVIGVLFLPCSVHAANSKQEKVITKQLNAYFKQIKNYNIPKAAQYYVPQNKRNSITSLSADYSPIGKVVRKIQKATFGYSIESITIKGNKAIANVKVVYYDASDDTDDAYTNMLHWAYTQKSSTSAKAYKKWASYLWDSYKDSIEDYQENLQDIYNEEYEAHEEYDEAIKDEFDDIFVSKIISIPLVKIGNKWLISKHTKEMAKMIDCNVSDRIMYIRKHPKEYLKFYS